MKTLLLHSFFSLLMPSCHARLGLTGKDWERLGGAPTRTRDCGTTRRRDDETTRQRDHETTGRRDDETAKNPGVLSHSQAFSVVRGCARLCEVAWRQKGCRCGASQKRAPRDSTKTYSPWCFTFWDVPQMRPYHAKCRGCAAITPS